MYLIIENSDGLYAYFETKKHFKKASEYRNNLTRINMTVLDDECDLSSYGENFYIVIPVNKKKLLKKRKKR